jgi:hypothetical protein
LAGSAMMRTQSFYGCFRFELKKLRLTIVSVQVVPSHFAQKKRGESYKIIKED